MLSFSAKVARFFLYSSLYIISVALLMVYGTVLLFHLNVQFPIYLFVSGGTMCSYNFHWFLSPPGQTSLRRKARMHLVLAIAGFVIAMIAACLMLQYWAWLALSMVFTFLYSAPKIPLRPFIWLRRIAIGKTIFLAAAWTYVTCLLPIVDGNNLTHPAVAGYLANRFLLIYSICILFDYRDLREDIQSGIRTLLTWLGIENAIWLFTATLVLFTGSLVLLANYFGLWVLIALALPALVTGLLYNTAIHSRSDYLYYLVLDGLMMASTPLLLFINLLNKQ